MNIGAALAALDLPASALVNQRVSKKLLAENAARTATDRRRINEGIEEIHWLAVLKPTTVGVPAFRDAVREYLEIAVLSAVIRPGPRMSRLVNLIHRAIPYPVYLIAADNHSLAISLVHKRWSLGESGHTVFDGYVVSAVIDAQRDSQISEPFLRAMPIAQQPRGNLYLLYQGWTDTLTALLAARITGVFAQAESPSQAELRRNALSECERLEALMIDLRADALKESQLSRKVAINMDLKRVQSEYSAARANL